MTISSAAPSRRLTASMINHKTLRNPLATLTRWWRGTVPAITPPRLSLALQGGGAHGAFTWGVLDALLDESALDFDALSGSSAGAINAVVMTQGWIKGGRQGARQALSDFWLEVGKQIPWPLLTQGNGEFLSLTPAAKMFASWVGLFSPNDFNPMALNPLRDVLNRQIEFEQIRHKSPFQLFVGATHVNTGKLRLFREQELTVDMVLASACLPKIHHTVEIGGEPYWDGGFCANPAVFPLVQDAKSIDVLLVLLAPHQHDKTPLSMEAIESRIQELGFKTHFLREMNMYARQLPASMALDKRRSSGTNELHRTRFHMIDSNLDVLQRSETKVLAYLAMSAIKATMNDNTTFLPAAANNVLKLSTINAGATYEVSLGTDATIGSDWVPKTMSVPTKLLGKDLLTADSNGNSADVDTIANVDNLWFSEASRTLFLGEDSGMHVNNFVWAYNVDTQTLSRIFSAPAGAECTGLQAVDNLNGFTYVMSNFQHPGDWEAIHSTLLNASTLNAEINTNWSGKDKVALGYMVLPAIGT